ncbi:phosphoadenosine phosphosulfate reductase family protein, partial [Mycobacteroides abscessus]|uniref:phosphoadenosine phosphosulfate reductase domain-containing protein n=1 Tax=Mycobacteroides abscessus TaxID=36809 RepID=UPI003CECC76A
MMADPTIRVLSLGAGVQSTVLALMACDGTLPGLDAAVFADTGWEPPAVYEQVDRLAAELARVDIPLYRVSSGNLRADTLDPEARFVSMFALVRTTKG